MNGKVIALIVAAKITLLFILIFPKKISFGELKVFAKESPNQAPETEKKPPEIKPSVLSELLDLPKIDPEKSKKEEIERYLELAETAKQQIDDKKKGLVVHEAKLKNIEETIDKKLKALEEERNFFVQSIQKEKEIQQDRLNTLVDIYTKMEPKKAAPVFATLDKDLMVALFKKLKQKILTQIIEAMSPDQSKTVTEYFARVGSAREYDILKEMNVSLQDAFQECKKAPTTGALSPEATAPTATAPATPTNTPEAPKATI